MTKIKTKENDTNRRNALVVFVLLIIISFVFLIGATYAWFTDNASSGRNKIVAGNLDVELEYALIDAERDAEGNIVESAWKKLGEEDNIFKSSDEMLWEPGHTEIAYLRIKNNGTLALKYDFAVNPLAQDGGEEKSYVNALGSSFKLSQYLILNRIEGVESKTRNEYWVKDDAATTDVDEELASMGNLSSASESVVLAPNQSTVLTLAVYMPTKVGNEANQASSDREANGAPELTFGVTVTATQTESEADSFGSDYDTNAE